MCWWVDVPMCWCVDVTVDGCVEEEQLFWIWLDGVKKNSNAPAWRTSRHFSRLIMSRVLLKFLGIVGRFNHRSKTQCCRLPIAIAELLSRLYFWNAIRFFLDFSNNMCEGIKDVIFLLLIFLFPEQRTIHLKDFKAMKNGRCVRMKILSPYRFLTRQSTLMSWLRPMMNRLSLAVRIILQL